MQEVYILPLKVRIGGSPPNNGTLVIKMKKFMEITLQPFVKQTATIYDVRFWQ